jgi:hypothetical protein
MPHILGESRVKKHLKIVFALRGISLFELFLLRPSVTKRSTTIETTLYLLESAKGLNIFFLFILQKGLWTKVILAHLTSCHVLTPIPTDLSNSDRVPSS